MCVPNQPNAEPSRSLVYQIKLEGHLDQQWANWFEGAVIVLKDNGHTLLLCPVADQTALFGLLKKVRDIGMPLVSINRIKTGPLATKEQD